PRGAAALLLALRLLHRAELGWDDARWEAEVGRTRARWKAHHTAHHTASRQELAAVQPEAACCSPVGLRAASVLSAMRSSASVSAFTDAPISRFSATSSPTRFTATAARTRPPAKQHVTPPP